MILRGCQNPVLWGGNTHALVLWCLLVALLLGHSGQSGWQENGIGLDNSF